MLNDKNKLSDEELKKVNGGMKILTIKSSQYLSKILPFFFKLKKSDTQGQGKS